MQANHPELERFKDVVKLNVTEAAGLLIELAKQYSRSEAVQSEAVSLRSDLFEAPDIEEVRRGIAEDMLELSERIFDQEEVTPDASYFKDIEDLWLSKREARREVFICKGVYKEFQNTNFTLQDINLTLRAGEITGVIGENGNGKTTLLKIIAGQSPPDRGSISYGVLEDKDMPSNWSIIKYQIAYLPQELGELSGSVLKSIQYEAALHGILGKNNDREVESIIQRLGLGIYKKATWQELSGGFKLRFALAKTLVWKPKVLLLDEPLANLDINTRLRVLSDLRDLSKSIKHPISIVLSSQNIEEVEAVADNMLVLKKGVIAFNDRYINIGSNRHKNVFEFKCDCTIEELEQKFADIKNSKLSYNGFAFYLTTPLYVTESVFLEKCLRQNIRLKYFQDISLSTKQLIIQS